ncbi:MAG: tripartite tricarboxylate transporter TctB family protein, partial [Gemmiger sp.]
MDQQNKEKKAYRQSIAVAVVIMAFAAAAFLLSLPMPGNAPIFPRMASAFLFACGLGLLISAVRRRKRGEKPETPAVDFSTLQSPLVIFLLVVVYALGFKYVGF